MFCEMLMGNAIGRVRKGSEEGIFMVVKIAVILAVIFIMLSIVYMLFKDYL